MADSSIDHRVRTDGQIVHGGIHHLSRYDALVGSMSETEAYLLELVELESEIA